MTADKNWIYGPTRNPYHNCPAHHQFEVNFVSWRLEISEVELTNDDTANAMIIDGHTLPCYFADKPTTKAPFTTVWFMIFYQSLHYKTSSDVWPKSNIDFGLKLIRLYTLHIQKNLNQYLALKVQHTHMFMLLIHKILTTPVSHVLKYILQLKHFVVSQDHYILHNIQIFLLHTLMVSTCIQDNLTLNLWLIKKLLAKFSDNSNNKLVFPALNVWTNLQQVIMMHI